MVRIGLLGPFLLVDDGDDRHEVTARERGLLALLALHAGRTLAREQLIDALWDHDLPTNPANALQQRVLHARRALTGVLDLSPEDRREATQVLATTGNGYQLSLAPDDVDVHRFERRRARGQRALEAGELDLADEQLQAALAEFRGAPLQDVTSPWAPAEAARLEELRLQTLEDRIEVELQLGRHRSLVAELEQLTEQHPLRERLTGQRMRALAASGRRADALSAYDAVRRLLADELGLDPSADLQRLHTQLLRDDLPTPPVRPNPTPRAPVLRLPATSSSFIGRDREVARLRALLSRDRIVTVTGPGGAGKSRLAVEAARAEHLADPAAGGATFVALGSVVDPAAVPAVTATALEVTRQAPGGMVDAIVNQLAGGPARLVLDNAEHLVEAVASLASELLARCPQLTVLVTSREPLGVDGEVVWPLDTLPVPPAATSTLAEARRSPAVELLLDRVAAAAPDLEVSDTEVAAIVRLVRELDGLPLAIELAAARARTLSLEEIADRLEDRFALLTGGRRSAPSRHRALVTTLEWSWDLLDDQEHRAWMAASVPAGAFTITQLAPVVAALDAELDPLDAVACLTDRSLLRVVERGRPTRYQMLGSIREFGLDRLAESQAEAAARTAHADTTEAAVTALDRTDEHRWDVDIEDQRVLLPELRTAIRWRLESGDPRGAQRLAASIGWLCYLTALTSEGRRLLDLTLGPIEELDVETADARAVLWAAGLRIGDASPDGARWAEKAAEVADDPVSTTLALGFCTAYRVLEGDLEGALALAEGEAEIGGWLEGMWRMLLGKLYTFAGRLDEAYASLRAGQELLVTAASWSHLLAGDTLVQLAQLRGDIEAVRQAVADGIAVCRAHDAEESELELQCLLAMSEAAVGEQARAAQALARCHDLLEATSLAMAGAMVAQADAYAAFRAGQDEVAVTRWQEAVELHHWTGFAYGTPFAWWGLGHLALRRNELAEATSLMEAAYREAADRQDLEATVTALEGHAAVALATGDEVRAARILGAAAVRRAAMGAPCPLVTGTVAAQTREEVRDHLGRERMEEEQQVGAAMDPADLLTRS